MKEFVSHINYLIQKHDCVIIPEFGGFVLNHVGASFAIDGSVLPPKVTVGFNAELRHNDGLLAESYMSVYSITYDEAEKRIKEAVKRLNTILALRHPVQIGHLGKLSIDKNNYLLFTPNLNFSIFHPQTFGLSTLNLKRLIDIQEDKAKAKRKFLLKRFLAGTGAAAAAILLFFVASTPVSEQTNTQKSSLFIDWISSIPSEQLADEVTEPSMPTTIQDNEVSRVQGGEGLKAISAHSSVLEKSTLDNNQIEHKVQPEFQKGYKDVVSNQVNRNYYLIIAGATSQNEAQTLLKKYKSQGFETVDIVSSNNRLRLYVQSFLTRSEAESYLVSFKKNNPQFRDAWVYFKN